MNLKVKVIFLAKMVLNGAKVPKTLNANFPLQLPHWGSWITGVSWALLKGHPHTSFLRSSLLVELRKFYRAFLNCWSWLADDASRPILAPNLAILGPLLGGHFDRWVLAVFLYWDIGIAFAPRLELVRLEKREGELKGKNRAADLCSTQV